VKAVDFTVQSVAGMVPFYKDASRDALAINAVQEANRDLWAGAQYTFNGVAGDYDLNLVTLLETDGESPYRIQVNGAIVATFENAATTTDYTLQENVVQNVDLIACLKMQLN